MCYTNIHSNIILYQKYIGTTIKVGNIIVYQKYIGTSIKVGHIIVYQKYIGTSIKVGTSSLPICDIRDIHYTNL